MGLTITMTAVTSSTPSLWTVDTLGAHLLSGIAAASVTGSRTASDELLSIVRYALRDVWEAEDWRCLMKTGTLTIAADGTTSAVADDFRKFDSKWTNDNEEQGQWLRFTNNLREVTGLRSRLDDDYTARPQLACICRDTSDTDSFAWIAQLVPTSDAAYSHDYVYLPTCPIDLPSDHADFKTDAESPVMPSWLHALWHDKALYMAQRHYRMDPEVFGRSKTEYTQGLSRAKSDMNESMTSDEMRVRDEYDDIGQQQAIHGRYSGDPDQRLPG